MFPACKECGHPMPPRRCLQCGTAVEAHTNVTTGQHSHPVPEQDVSICAYCSSLSMFTESGLRELTDEEWRYLMEDEGVCKAVMMANHLRQTGRVEPPWT